MVDSERLLEGTPRQDPAQALELLPTTLAGFLVLTNEFCSEGPKIAFANDEFLTLSGYGWGELRGKALNRLLEPGLTPSALEQLEHQLAKGEAWRSEASLRLASETRISVELRAQQLMQIEANRVAFVLEIRRHHERDTVMSFAEQRCRVANHSKQDGLVLLGPQRDPRGMVVDFAIMDLNETAAEMLSARRDVLRGKSLSEVAPRMRAGECFLQCVNAVETGLVQHATSPGSAVGLRAKWIRWHVVPMQAQVAISFSDVSWEQELALQVARASRFESIGSLAVGIAHDFNNMLAAIIGFSELARDALPHDSPARLDVEQVIGAADRATRLTRYLLAFGSRQPLEPQLVNIGASLSDLGPILNRLTGPSIDVSMHFAGSLSTWADPGQLEQAIVNLVVNARDAMPHGGVLSIRVAAVTVVEGDREYKSGCEPGEYAAISVEDTGIGMDEQTRERIFEPFFTTKAEQGGTGLGLASTYGFVKQSGGAILVDSEKGRGTTFRLLFPLIQVARRPSSVPAPCLSGPVERCSATILMVESDEHVRNVARRVLEANGFAVLEATNSREAQEKLDRYPGELDVLLSAMRLPGSTGIELARQAIQRHPHLSIVLMSGAADMNEVEEAADYLGAYFLQKPFTAQTLKSTVHAAVGTERRGLGGLYANGRL